MRSLTSGQNIGDGWEERCAGKKKKSVKSYACGPTTWMGGDLSRRNCPGCPATPFFIYPGLVDGATASDVALFWGVVGHRLQMVGCLF